jgi:hypothetical protein
MAEEQLFEFELGFPANGNRKQQSPWLYYSISYPIMIQ